MFKLVSIKPRTAEENATVFGREPSECQPSWSWLFEAVTETDSTGNKYVHRVDTGVRYGNPNAKLTKLYDALFSEKTEDEKYDVDTDDLVGTFWYLVFKHENPPKPDGTPGKRKAVITRGDMVAEPLLSKAKVTTRKTKPMTEDLPDLPDYESQ